MGLEEKDLARRKKIDCLKLSSGEWERVDSFLGLLAVRRSVLYIPCCTHLIVHLHAQHADHAQQEFSTDQVSTLHRAIPALEGLHKAWLSRAERPKYARFAPALRIACAKVDKYYQKTCDNVAYIIAMRSSCNPWGISIPMMQRTNESAVVLNPGEKMRHFKKHWSEDLQDEVLQCAEEVVSLVSLPTGSVLTDAQVSRAVLGTEQGCTYLGVHPETEDPRLPNVSA
jgi:hypothetical protein